MNCPVDGSELRISERQGVEVDYCPQCRGVWLDRGELDKILDRMAGSPSATAGRGADTPRRTSEPGRRDDVDRDRDDDRDRYDDDRYDSRDGRKKRRRRSFLDDLFDFDLG